MYIGGHTLALVAFGANLELEGRPPAQTVAAAMAQLGKLMGGKARVSHLYQTPAFPAGAGPDFVNAAMQVMWDRDAQSLLQVLHGLEREFGRVRRKRWEARVMDLDLIGFGDLVLPDRSTWADWNVLSAEEAAKRQPDSLILPHPRLAERSFVLVPLAEVAPNWVHPILGQTPRQMLSALDPADVETVRRIN